ncbi:glycoside hydrolase family 16 protein [Ephemerocybe angulata]|uniref:Glycoside hydrolase family 16 protein n=1 Tax=Ephemerocybe angulata TaxID=980116 RepID=A0A8H6I188_9AGAR|nr:glycoside hydrolase family 16 protein [Tulosesus angulatus]
MPRYLCILAYIACFFSVTRVLGATYSLSDNVLGNGFYDAFKWETIDDPTHGRVKYVDQGTSRSQNLTYASGDTFILRTDFKTYLNNGGPGRQSVRIMSKRTYTTHVAVFDVRHMPQGCGTWPAIWETAEGNWPYSGEVDIVEGVNDQAPNAASLHTGPGCSMPPAGRDQTGTNGQLDCNALVNGNTGCGVTLSERNSYGPSFNNNGGGWYALERNNNFIKVWFWPRNSGSVPSDVRNGAQRINTDGWGTPAAHFPNTQCNIAQHFDAHSIIINLTLCGDWAGNVYEQSGCPSSCVDYVNNNPSGFRDAYFDFAAMRVYQ